MGVEMTGDATLLAWAAVVVLLAGEILALRQVDNLARVLVFSSIAECGYVLLGLGIENPAGQAGAVLHLGFQGVMRGLVFVAAWRLSRQAGSWRLAALRGSYQAMPLTTALFGFGLFSVMGLSPFKGAISKFLVIYSAIEAGHWALAAAGTVASIIAAVYFLRIIQRVCLEKGDREQEMVREGQGWSFSYLVMLALTALTIYMSLAPEPFIHGAQKVARLWSQAGGQGALPEFESPWSLLVLVPYLGGFLCYILGRISPVFRNIFATLLAGLTLVLAWQAVGLDPLSRLFAVVMAGIGLLVVLYSAAYMKGKAHENRYFFFLLLLLGSLLGVSTSHELGNFYLFWELMTWTSYFLVIHDQTDRALKAGSKYFLMCASGAYVMHFGILTLHAELGSFDLAEIAERLHLLSPGMATIVLVTFVIGFGVKTGLVPVHGWLPDAHPVAPASISAPMSGILTKAGVYGLLRILFVVFGAGMLARLGSFGPLSGFGAALSLAGMATLLYGEVMALRQDDLKRMLAYSTMAQVGEIVAVLGLGTYLATAGALLHLLNHAVMKNLLFLAAGALIYRLKSQSIASLRGAGRQMPVTAICFAVGVLSIMGLPPFGGFVSKFLMIYAGAQGGQILLPAVILFGSVLGGIYYLRLVRLLFFEKYAGAPLKEAPLPMLLPLLALSGLCVFNGLLPWAGLDLVRPVAELIAARGQLPVTAIPDLTMVWPLAASITAAGSLMVYALGRGNPRRAGLTAVLTMTTVLLVLLLQRGRFDPFSLGFALLIAGIGLANLLYSVGYMGHGHAQNRFYLFFMLMIAGLLGVALSDDLFSFFAFWEIMSSWSLYFVIIHEETPEALGEGFKYFLFNYIGASLMFLGLALLCAKTGTFEMALIAGRLADLPPLWVGFGLSLVLLGLAMKGAMVPLRIDYQMHPPTAPTPVSGYISAVLLKSAPFGMAKLFFVFGGVALLGRLGQSGHLPTLMYLVAVGAGITVLIAGAMAILQSGIKRLLIYSTVSQISYVVLGISLGTSLGVAGGLMHLVNHMLLKNILFLGAGCILAQAHIDSLDRLGGLGRKMPVTFGLFLFAGLSLAGIPPLNGFSSKWLIYHAAMEQGHVFLALAALASSILTLAAVLKFAHCAFLGQLSKEAEPLTEAPMLMVLPMAALALACLVIGLLPGLVLVPISSIQAVLGLDPISASLFGPLPGPGGWHPGLMALMAAVVLLSLKAACAFGPGTRKSVSLHTCGVTDLKAAHTHVGAGNLYGPPKALVRRCIGLFVRTPSSAREE